MLGAILNFWMTLETEDKTVVTLESRDALASITAVLTLG
jgi:hypothetical protein